MAAQGGEDSPIVKLANAILLSALKRQASLISLRLDEGGRSIVEFVVDGALVTSMEPDAKLHSSIVRRLGVMASVPVRGKDQTAVGRIRLHVGERKQQAYFDLTERGHGATLRVQLAVHGFVDEPPPFSPPGAHDATPPLR